MHKSNKVHIRLVLTVFTVVLLLAFAPSPSSLEASRIEQNLDALAGLATGQAWVTMYNDEGGYTDIAYVPFGAEEGYGTALSPLIEYVVDSANNSYVLNWRPNYIGSDLQLCGLRVAYRLPLESGGFSSMFSYVHVPGSVLRPRNSTSKWRTDWSGGCIYQTSGEPYQVFNLHLNVPDGSRIDYLRVYYYRHFQYVYLPLTMRNF